MALTTLKAPKARVQHPYALPKEVAFLSGCLLLMQHSIKILLIALNFLWKDSSHCKREKCRDLEYLLLLRG